MSRAPDFVGVGAEAAGAGWWWSLIADHPGVHVARKRELHFFDEFCVREMDDADVARYHAEFAGAGDAATGEWTARYMDDAWSPPLLRRAAPEVRVIALLRDPLERFRTGVARQLRRNPERRAHLVCAEELSHSGYGTHLRRLRASFDADRILVLQYERCRRDPAAEYARTLAFLGLDEDHRPAGLGDEPPAEGEAGRLWADLEIELCAELRAEARAAAELCPAIDLELWPGCTTS